MEVIPSTVLALLITTVILAWMGVVALATPAVTYRMDRRVEAASAEFQRLISVTLGATMSGGNRVTRLDNGASFYPAMLAAVRAAERSIALECYILHPGTAGDAFMAALSERARAGVKVRIIVDAIGSRRLKEHHVSRLTVAGCEVAWHPRKRWWRAHRLINSTHREILVVDGRVAFTGGAGISDWWQGGVRGQPPWRDTMVRLEGPIVAACLAVFVENWLECRGGIVAGDEWFPPLEANGTISAMVVRNSPSFAGSRALFQALVECAAREIRLSTPYFVPDPSFLEALIDRARSGVAITILLPGPRMDHQWVRLSSRRLFRPLLDAGVRIFEYQPSMIHQKLMVVDGLWTVVGTTNLDMLSFEYLDEINVAIRDEAFATQQVRRHDVDLRNSIELTRTWHRATGERMLAGTVWALAGQRWAMQLRRRARYRRQSVTI